MIDENEIIQVVDDDGNILELHILFTYNDEETETDYLFLYEKDNPDDIIVRKLTKDDILEELTDEEFKQANEVFLAFESEEKEQ